MQLFHFSIFHMSAFLQNQSNYSAKKMWFPLPLPTGRRLSPCRMLYHGAKHLKLTMLLLRTAEDSVVMLSLILLLASLRAVSVALQLPWLSGTCSPSPPSAHGESKACLLRNASLAEQGAHPEASPSVCSTTLQPGEQQFAPNSPKRCSWDHGAPGRLMKCKALPSAHINHSGLVPVLFKASLFSYLWQISILC